MGAWGTIKLHQVSHDYGKILFVFVFASCISGVLFFFGYPIWPGIKGIHEGRSKPFTRWPTLKGRTMVVFRVGSQQRREASLKKYGLTYRRCFLRGCFWGIPPGNFPSDDSLATWKGRIGPTRHRSADEWQLVWWKNDPRLGF